jgi:phosphatidylinositol alpha-1,6-mannosyltransferase
MTVLMISLDTTFLAEKGGARGDVLLRHIRIAEKVSHLHVIVFSTGSARAASLRPTEKLTLYPTQSVNKAMRVPDAFRIGLRVCRRNGIDVLTTQDAFFTGMVGWGLKALFRIPLNVQVHADCVGNPHWLSERLLNRFLNVTGRALIKRAENVRVVSSSEKEKMIRLGVPESRVWNIPTGGGIDVSRFSSADGSRVRTKHLREAGKWLVLFAGRLTKQKRIPDLLRAAEKVTKELPGTVFVIAGDGNEAPAAKALCGRLRLHEQVVFTGNVAYEEMPAYFAAADVFALPSGYEGTARVLMESVAAGVPIVTTKVSGVSELVVDGENGHIVPVGRPQEMAEKLIQVLKHSQRYREGSLRQRQAVAAYERNANLPRVVEMWTQIAEKRPERCNQMRS